MPAVLALNDRCYLGTQGTVSSFEPRAAYSYDTGTEVRCAVMNEVPAEDKAGIQLPQGLTRIAFKRDSGVDAGTRIQVFKRLRQTLDASEYYIVDGEPRLLRNRLLAMCRRTDARSAK